MNLPELTNGNILKRYKRFLADVELEDGRKITALSKYRQYAGLLGAGSAGTGES